MNLWDVTDYEGDRFVVNIDTICDIYVDGDSPWLTNIGLMNGDVITLDMKMSGVLETLRGILNERYARY